MNAENGREGMARRPCQPLLSNLAAARRDGCQAGKHPACRECAMARAGCRSRFGAVMEEILAGSASKGWTTGNDL